MELRILDTDKFFYDSPDAGEPGCICSRCKNQITEDEIPLRIAVEQEVLYAKNPKTGKEKTKKVDLANGTEFRLCDNCQRNAGIYFQSTN